MHFVKCLFETQQFHPLILFESWLHVSLNLITCNAIVSFGNRKSHMVLSLVNREDGNGHPFVLARNSCTVSRCIVTVEKPIIQFSLFRVFFFTHFLADTVRCQFSDFGLQFFLVEQIHIAQLY